MLMFCSDNCCAWRHVTDPSVVCPTLSIVLAARSVVGTMFGMNATFSATANRLFAKHVSTATSRSGTSTASSTRSLRRDRLASNPDVSWLTRVVAVGLVGRWRCV